MNTDFTLFPEVAKGPQQRRTPAIIQQQIIQLRKQNLAAADIHTLLIEQQTVISLRTIERILNQADFPKLKRRTRAELGLTRDNKLIGERSQQLDWSLVPLFRVNCPVAGVFFFIPYVIESGIVDIVRHCDLLQSSDISAVNACLALLVLKLIGNKRLSQMDAYDHEPGNAYFVNLILLNEPKHYSISDRKKGRFASRNDSLKKYIGGVSHGSLAEKIDEELYGAA